MDTITINKSLSNTPGFIGTFPRDKLPKLTSVPCSFIANTDNSDAPGQHWVAIFIDEEGFGEYFDSYGLPPMHQEFIDFLNNLKGWFYSSKQLQCLTCVTCGHYCVAYIKMRSSGIIYNEFIRQFTNNPIANDKLIKKYVNLI